MSRIGWLSRPGVLVCHDARTTYGGEDLTPELLLLGMMVGQAANVYNLSPPGGLIDPGSCSLEAGGGATRMLTAVTSPPCPSCREQATYMLEGGAVWAWASGLHVETRGPS